MWHPHPARLADTFYGVAPDLPRHGALAEVPFRFETAVRELAALIKTRLSRPPLVIGTSLGGYTAAALSARHPDLVAGLVLSGCTFNPTGLWTPLLRLNAFAVQAAAFLLGEGMLRRTTAASLGRHLDPERVEQAIMRGPYAAAHVEALRALAETDLLQLLAGFPGPLLS